MGDRVANVRELHRQLLGQVLFCMLVQTCPSVHARATHSGQWPEVYDLCHTFLHAFRVQFSHVRVFSDSRNVQKRATKSDTSGHCLTHTHEREGRREKGAEGREGRRDEGRGWRGWGFEGTRTYLRALRAFAPCTV